MRFLSLSYSEKGRRAGLSRVVPFMLIVCYNGACRLSLSFFSESIYVPFRKHFRGFQKIFP